MLKINLKTEKELQSYIRLAMQKEKINKKNLAFMLDISYPTMLKYLESPYLLTISQLNSICQALQIDIKITLNKEQNYDQNI